MAGSRNTSPMEAMPGADVDRETPVRESGERERVLDAGDAERELGELGKRSIEEAKEIAGETSSETKGVSDELQKRYDEPMEGGEGAALAAVDAKLAVAEQRLEEEVTAAMAEAVPDLKTLEKEQGDAERAYDVARKKGDGDETRRLEARIVEIQDQRKKLMAEQQAAKKAEAPPRAAPEAVAPAPQEAPAPSAKAELSPDVAQKIAAMRQQKEVNLKQSGLSESMAAKINAAIDRDIAELEAQAVPAAETASPAVPDEGPEVTVGELSPEEEAEVREAAAETPRLALEEKMRGLEAKLAAASAEEKPALMRTLEETTRQWEEVSKAEGVEVTRPRDPADIRPELPKAEPANDNAVAVEKPPVEVVAAAVAAVAETGGEKKGDEKNEDKKKKKEKDDDGPDPEAERQRAIAAEYKGLSGDIAKASQAYGEVSKQHEEAKKAVKEQKGDVLDAIGRGIGAAYDAFKESGLKQMLEATGEMVGGDKGKGTIDSKLLEGLSAGRKEYKKKMAQLEDQKSGIAAKESKLKADLAALGQRMSELSAVALDQPEWVEVRKTQDALKAQEKAVEAAKAEIAAEETALEEEDKKLRRQERQEEADKQAAADREAILPDAPKEAEKPPEPPEPDPPVAAKPPDDAAPKPPAAPTETKLAA